MEGLGVLERIVSLASLLQGNNPLTLLLSTCISFTPELCQDVCRSTDWNVFQQSLQSLGPGERIRFLTRAFQQQQPLPGYQALVRLVKAGFFSTIFTCNPDSQLEEQLTMLGCQPHVLVVNEYSAEPIARFLENPREGPCVIKLHGSLRENSLPETFPQVSALPEALLDILQIYLNRDLVVVGSLARDPDVARLLLANRKSSLYYILPQTPDPYDEVRRTIEARGYPLNTFVLSGEQGAFSTFFHALETQLSKQQTLITSHPPINQFSEQSVAAKPVDRADVLLVTVTEVERDAVLEFFPHATLLHLAFQSYYHLGLVGGARVYLVQQPDMGSGNAGGSILTIFKGILALAPATVIMVGIAFGFEPEKFAIGDILISEQIQLYEFQRVSSNAQNRPHFQARGARPAVSPRLLSLFKNNAHGWSGQQTAFGVILSGDKLIDNVIYRDEIRGFAPEALGGEMEGAGLFAASQDHAHPVDWILVKAISDWADGNKGANKKANQLKAARSAARFVFHVLGQGGFNMQ